MLLTPACLLASALPRVLAWPLAAAAMAQAFRGWRRYRALPVRVLRVPAEGALQVDGECFEQWRLRWRGAWAFIEWRDPAGHRQALAFVFDTLQAAQRRELRLATPLAGSTSPAAGMAT